MDTSNKLPVLSPKAEIKLKESPAAAAIKRAPDEVIAKAIHDAILKDHQKWFKSGRKTICA